MIQNTEIATVCPVDPSFHFHSTRTIATRFKTRSEITAIYLNNMNEYENQSRDWELCKG